MDQIDIKTPLTTTLDGLTPEQKRIKEVERACDNLRAKVREAVRVLTETASVSHVHTGLNDCGCNICRAHRMLKEIIDGGMDC